MKYICLVCNKVLRNKRGLSTHIRSHNLTIYEYRKKFNLLCYCPSCSKEISCTNKTGYCTSCRDRTKENNPFYKKTHKENTKIILKQKCKIATEKMWEDDEYRKKVISGTSKPRNEKFKQEQSKRIKKWFGDNPHQKDIRAENMRRYWKEGIIVKTGYSSNHSKLEKLLFRILKRIDCNFKEKKTIKIKNKWFFPDIVDFNKKIIIEFFGDFWHCNPKFYNREDDFNFGLTVKDVWQHDRERIELLKSAGYKVIIIWEDDFKHNQKQTIQKIKNFIL